MTTLPPTKHETSFNERSYACNINGSMTLRRGQRHGQLRSKVRRARKRVVQSMQRADLAVGAGELFCKYTSAHGFRCAASPERSTFIRLLWKLSIVVSLSSLTWVLFELKGNYYNFPLKTLVDVKYVSQLPFPSVTLCNLHAYDYRKADVLPNVTHGAAKLINLHIAESIASEKGLEDYENDPSYHDIMRQPFSTIYKTLGANLSDTIRYCAWDGVKVACEAIFMVVPTMDGLCYQFNNNISHPVTSSLVGPSAGLSVVFVQTGNSEDPMMSGLKVLLHQPGGFPDMHTQGFLVPLGFSTFGRLQIRQAIHLPYPYKSYGDNYCLSNEEMAEEPGYNRDSCIASCAYSLTANACNCSIYPQDETGPGKSQCTLRQALFCIRPTFANALLEASANNNTCSSCKYKCDVTTFSMTTSQATFPSSTDHRTNYLELRLFYEHMTTEKMTYEKEYTWHSILGIVGGYMGLFIGASVLTICEAIECLIFGTHQFLRKLTHKTTIEDLTEATSEYETSTDGELYNH